MTNGSRAQKHKVELLLLFEGQEMARWTFNGCLARRHALVLADDGRPVEQIYFSFPPPVSRRIREHADIQVSRGGFQRGFVSGAGKAAYEPWLNQVNLGGKCVIVNDVLDSSSYDVTGSEINVRVVKVEAFNLVQSPLARTDLFEWFVSLTPDGEFRTLHLNLGDLRLKSLTNAWPSEYQLQIGDDGLPYEWFQIHCDTIAVP